MKHLSYIMSNICYIKGNIFHYYYRENNMNNKTEILNRSRRKMLIGVVIGFGFWQGSHTIKSFFPDLLTLSSMSNILRFIEFFGLLGWIYFSFNSYRMVKMIIELKRNPTLNQTLNDEFYKHIRIKAFKTAFFVVLITQVFLLLLNLFYEISAWSIINLNILS